MRFQAELESEGYATILGLRPTPRSSCLRNEIAVLSVWKVGGTWAGPFGNKIPAKLLMLQSPGGLLQGGGRQHRFKGSFP